MAQQQLTEVQEIWELFRETSNQIREVDEPTERQKSQYKVLTSMSTLSQKKDVETPYLQ